MIKTRKEKCFNSLAWLGPKGYSVVQAKMVNNTTGVKETLDWDFDDLLEPDESCIPESDKETIDTMLCIKINITYQVELTKSYHNYVKLCLDIIS